MKGWKTIKSNNSALVIEAIEIAKKCKVKKCAITIKGNSGELESFATVEKR